MPMVTMRDGTAVFVRVLGRGQPVLMLHGFALDSRHWLPLIAPYLNSYRFIMPDFRGHGRSGTGDLHRSRVLDTLCDDVDDILDFLKIEKVLLCAYSMGAMVGLEYALRRQQERVERYLHMELSPCFHHAEDWAHGFNPQLVEQARVLVDLWEQKSAAAGASYRTLIQEMVRQAFPQRWVMQMVDVLPVRLLDPILPDPAFTHEIFSFLLESNFDVRSRVPHFQIPGLIMSGRQSRYFPWEGSDWLHQNWEKSEHLIFDHSGHGLMYSEPIKFRKAFQCFLTGALDRVREIRTSRNWLRLRTAG
ncbi:alpha/beta fold hydrolase [Oligoflexus tunisiensis]|uniref:alpha/beta fold hydrolase n=1 Tax=Oligoflexus tunisiensis TaxID=708132 RepID=UPI00114CA0B0|nr:alpha/beta hydrolase [Oligoflexus tunisiensis]